MREVPLVEVDLVRSRKVLKRSIAPICALIFALSLMGQLRVGAEKPSQNVSEPTRNELLHLLTLSNETVRFKEGSKAIWMLQDGFHHPDSQGTLMSQELATIRFAVAGKDPIGASLLLSFFPFDGSPSTTVTVKSSIDEVTAEVAGLESISVALDGDSLQELHVECQVGLSQFDLDLGPDLRRQCIRVIELHISMEQF